MYCKKCGKNDASEVVCGGTYMELSLFGLNESRCDKCGKMVKSVTADGLKCAELVCSDCHGHNLIDTIYA